MANSDDTTASPSTVLLVDDSPTNLQVLMETLGAVDCKALVAKNGQSALTIARKARPQLVLLDIMMPEMDGFEVCRRLKADPATRDAAVIFLSALDDTQSKVDGLQLGAVDYITKPFQPAEVIARVQTHLKIRRLEHELAQQNRQLRDLNENLESKVEQKGKEILRSRDAVIFGLAKLAETRDDDTGLHLERICKYVELLARHLARSDPTLDEAWVHTVSITAALHDIGKVAIPDAVLLKPGPLTPAERKIIELHPTIGGDTLLEIREHWGSSFFLARAIEITMAHHEKWDGRGYPFGLQGEQIALSARLVAVADVYDALTCRRVYKDGMPHEKVCQIISQAAGQDFDPRVVDAFIANAEAFHATAEELKRDERIERKGQAEINRQQAFEDWKKEVCQFVAVSEPPPPKG